MTQGQCPSCGAPVVFSAGTAQVLVCHHCQTVVARMGTALESRGKVGSIVDTDSPLRLGAEGRVGGRGYRLVGHLQKDHGAGPWDEWYVEFEDGHSGWLSESEGAFHLMRASGSEPELVLEDFSPGYRFSLRDARWAVEERGQGRVVAAEGQLPEDVDPKADSRYVDATGPGGAFLSLDFGTLGTGAEVFLGRKYKLAELGIAPDQLRPHVKQVALQQARCTQCNGALELRAPDLAKRVACPYCGALLDASQGKLAFLQLLAKPKQAPLIPLGAKGRLADAEWVCIGFLVRSCRVEGVSYYWDEYLLFNRERGFTWLMCSNGHWVFLTPLDAGEVSVAQDKAAFLGGTRYRAFQRVTAVTEAVLGEFYWEVRKGEVAEAEEYVAPPYSVNVDRTANEVTYTKGEYLSPEQVRDAFGFDTPMPPREGVAPSQPNPSPSSSAWKWTGLWAAVLCALFFLVRARAAEEPVLTEEVGVEDEAQSGTPSAMHFSEPFEIHQRGNLRVQVQSQVYSNWLGVQGDLVDEASGEVTSFYEEVSYYSGVDSDGESWSEGSQNEDEYLSRVPAGRYVLRTTAFFDGTAKGQKLAYSVQVVSDSPRWLWFLVALGVLLAWPALASVRTSSFESKRWSESTLGGGSDSGSDD